MLGSSPEGSRPAANNLVAERREPSGDPKQASLNALYCETLLYFPKRSRIPGMIRAALV